MNKFIIKNENEQSYESVESDINNSLEETNDTQSNNTENNYTINGLNLLCDPKKKKI